jgi:integrase
MATFMKTPAGKWRAEISRDGKRTSKVFATKQESKDWAAFAERQILTKSTSKDNTTFGEAMVRYAREVSPTKRGELWETKRLKRFCNDGFAKIALRDLTSTDFSMWRDARLREVSNGTVSREMTLLSGILSVARREWRLIEGNPLSDVRMPREPPHRDRRVSEKELMALKISAGHDLTNATARAYHAFLFAIETAMRAGEIIGLRSEDISFEKRFARLPMTKNGTSRDVPLSSEAMRLVKELPKSDPVFNLSSHLLDALWRKLRDRAAVTDLRFHDSRHEAITRLARKLDVLDLARMVGHRDLKMLMIYYNATAEELAKRLD